MPTSQDEQVRLAPDSPLEGTGFEPARKSSSMSCDIDFWPNIDYLATKSPTIGTRKISYRFETDFVASMTVPVPERDSPLSRANHGAAEDTWARVRRFWIDRDTRSGARSQ